MRYLLPMSFLLAGAPAWSQVSAPFLGYFPDGAHIRPVYGIPAAAVVAPAVDAGREFARLAVSPKQDYVLASAADTGEVSIFRPGQQLAPLRGVAPAPDTVVVSPGGSAAALWFSSSLHMQILTGLPESPSVREVDAAFLGKAPAALAISDDGAWLVGAWSLGTYGFGPHGEVTRLPMEETPVALAFFAGSHDLAVANRLGLSSVIDVGGRAELKTLLAAGDSPLDAMALALSADNRLAVVATNAGAVVSVNLESGIPAMVDCQCAPEGLFPMGRSLFRLTGLNGGSFKLFDARTGEVLFAPLGLEEGGRQ